MSFPLFVLPLRPPPECAGVSGVPCPCGRATPVTPLHSETGRSDSRLNLHFLAAHSGHSAYFRPDPHCLCAATALACTGPF
jgi:hypothetical protein